MTLNVIGLDVTKDIKRKGKFYVAIGEHSDVWEANWAQGTPGKLAVKALRGGSSSNPNFAKEFREKLVQRGEIWVQLEHSNIAKFYGFSYDYGLLPALVLDFYDNGNIMHYIKKNEVDDETKLRLVGEIALGMKYLHRHRPQLVHGDLRGANVLVDSEGHARIADFGLAFIVDSSEFTSIKTAGTCRWTAPELMNPENADIELASALGTKTDVFAFAMTVIEIFTGEHPFPEKKNDSSVIFAILAKKRPQLPEFIKNSRYLGPLVESCWDHEPSRRPNMSKICRQLGVMSGWRSLFEWVGFY